MDVLRFRGMNTDIEAQLDPWEKTQPFDVHPVQAWFERSESRFSRFRPDSELSNLNDRAGERCLVSAPMLNVLELSDYYQKLTSGLFTVFLYHRMMQLGYSRSFEQIGSESVELLSDKTTTGKNFDMELDPRMQSVRLSSSGKLDLGGIVKGWTVKEAAAMMREQYGCRKGLINAGGDLEVWGATNAEPWLIAVANPNGETQKEIILELTNGAAATSSTLRRKWLTNRGTMHHLVDPRTMEPSANTVVQCTVVGKNLIDCEVWAKVLCVAGVEEGIPLFQKQTAGLEALLYTNDGKLHYIPSSRIRTQTRWHGLVADVIHDDGKERIECI
ncbi:FAD:protein FMN transferase [Paenibacillus hexagrammi]|uniref:FAD:protein FMN transferase n=1 Tax=Paenibacillus hexagrammi TaxID=2908839 RepID=A0ABY3SNA1_9BACL|nr:FAD:protein FMN transferase [Paenibacillus sp. YPD9-1]UJF34719.1 FAD:protein FMN transferase [Paenibacillus sp. YPD9-1]